MRDFTLYTLRILTLILKEKNYEFQPFINFLKNPAKKCIILRHDVDKNNINSLNCAILENELGIKGTYYFRITPGSFDMDIIKKIASLGHEIGYHYEDVSLTAKRQRRLAKGAERRVQSAAQYEKELLTLAIENFRDNLQLFRKIVPVETICMHGSPLSRWDNRLLWKYYDYRDYGIVGEPYFDIDFEKILYLTDTGRRWDGGAVAIRDKARSAGRRAQSKQNRFHSTFDIIATAKENRLPDQIMLTIHPQRWDDRGLPWTREFVWQNVKNIAKRVLVKKNFRDALYS